MKDSQHLISSTRLIQSMWVPSSMIGPLRLRQSTVLPQCPLVPQLGLIRSKILKLSNQFSKTTTIFKTLNRVSLKHPSSDLAEKVQLRITL